MPGDDCTCFGRYDPFRIMLLLHLQLLDGVVRSLRLMTLKFGKAGVELAQGCNIVMCQVILLICGEKQK